MDSVISSMSPPRGYYHMVQGSGYEEPKSNSIRENRIILDTKVTVLPKWWSYQNNLYTGEKVIIITGDH